MVEFKKIIDILKLYIKYNIYPLLILLTAIIYILSIIILILSGNSIVLYYFGNILSKLFSFNYIYEQNNINLIDKYVNSNEKFLMVFNHRSPFDTIVCLSLFKRNTYLLKTYYGKAIPLSNYIFKYMNLLSVQEKNTTDEIINYTKNRKYGQNVLALAPDQCKLPDEIINDGVGSFRTGAFVGMFPIMPIIIKYNNNFLDFKWENNETFLHCLFKVFLYKDYFIKVKVLDMVYPDENSSIEEYRDKVHNIMSLEYNKL